MPQKMDPVRHATIRRLAAQGITYRAIAQAYEISYQRVEQIVNGRQRRSLTTRRVYFAQVGDFIKIGIAANLPRRLEILRSSCPYPVVLLGTLPGGRPRELALHEQFASLRVHHEWFHYHIDIIQVLKNGDITHPPQVVMLQ